MGLPHILVLVLPIIVGVLVIFKNPRCHQNEIEAFFGKWRLGGHRGAPKSFPENSMAGFNQAKKEGVQLIEFDVSLTKDGVAVLLHDDDLDRTTNLRGPIRNFTLAELAKANIGHGYRREEKHLKEDVNPEKLPLLEEVVEWAVKNDMLMLFDIKDYDLQLSTTISSLFLKHNLYRKGIVCSFFPPAVYQIKKSDPRILTGLTWRQGFWAYEDIEMTKRRYRGVFHVAAVIFDYVYIKLMDTFLPSFLGVELLLTNRADISNTYVSQQVARGLHVAAWTVNEPSEMLWMTETLKIPILTDYPHRTTFLPQLEKTSQSAKN